MRKRDELTNPNSCMSRARDDEWTFVLLGRDVAAPAAVLAWIEERVKLGKNDRHDAQITEAEEWIAMVGGPQQTTWVDTPDGPGFYWLFRPTCPDEYSTTTARVFCWPNDSRETSLYADILGDNYYSVAVIRDKWPGSKWLRLERPERP